MTDPLNSVYQSDIWLGDNSASNNVEHRIWDTRFDGRLRTRAAPRIVGCTMCVFKATCKPPINFHSSDPTPFVEIPGVNVLGSVFTCHFTRSHFEISQLYTAGVYIVARFKTKIRGTDLKRRRIQLQGAAVKTPQWVICDRRLPLIYCKTNVAWRRRRQQKERASCLLARPQLSCTRWWPPTLEAVHIPASLRRG